MKQESDLGSDIDRPLYVATPILCCSTCYTSKAVARVALKIRKQAAMQMYTLKQPPVYPSPCSICHTSKSVASVAFNSSQTGSHAGVHNEAIRDVVIRGRCHVCEKVHASSTCRASAAASSASLVLLSPSVLAKSPSLHTPLFAHKQFHCMPPAPNTLNQLVDSVTTTLKTQTLSERHLKVQNVCMLAHHTSLRHSAKAQVSVRVWYSDKCNSTTNKATHS